MQTETAVIPRQTLAQMAEAWQIAQGEIEQACTYLESAKVRLSSAFNADGYGFDVDLHLSSKNYDRNSAQLIHQLKKNAWRYLVGRMGIRKLMSLAEQKELDKQLESGDGMPEITLPNLIAMLEGAMQNIPNMIEGLVKEVYNWLRPYSANPADYKTNQRNLWKLDRKVIKGYCVETWGSGHWRVNYHRQDQLTALDNVFHALDGKGIPSSHHGPLTDAIYALPSHETTGETDYFRFKCYKNGNLHIEFKRSDLVDKLNAVAGGMNLGDVQAQAA